jgi:hypothetical protein
MNRTGCAVLTAVISAVAATVSADPIAITKDARIVITQVESQDFTGDPPLDPTYQFRQGFNQSSDNLIAVAAVATATGAAQGVASLTSSLADPLHWFGAGTVDGLASARHGGVVISESNFAVEFDVARPVTYSFNGTYAGHIETNATEIDSATAGWFLRLFGNGPTQFFDSGQFGSGAVGQSSRSFSGIMQPGHYTFETSVGLSALMGGYPNWRPASGFIADGSSLDFTFDFTPLDAAPTPEPASMLLLCTGLAAVAARRRR